MRAPERIWFADRPDDDLTMRLLAAPPGSEDVGYVEYVRADLHEQVLADLEGNRIDTAETPTNVMGEDLSGPARLGYLAAVERLRDDEPSVGAMWSDREIGLTVDNEPQFGDVDWVRVGGLPVMPPGQLRKVAYSLLVIADEADAAGGQDQGARDAD